MITKIESEVFKFLTDKFEEYGIQSEFRYDENLDLLNEFRRSIRLRIENDNTFSKLVQNYVPNPNPDNPSNIIHNLGLFNRSPIRKSPNIGNNMNLQVYSNSLVEDYGIELRNAFFGEVDYTVRIMFDNHEVANIMELIYIYSLANKSLVTKIDYSLGPDIEPIEDVEYVIQLSELSSIGTLNGTNLRFLDFSFTLTGLFFMPFYQSEYKLETIVTSVHIMNRSTEPTPQNATVDNLVYQKTYNMINNR